MLPVHANDILIGHNPWHGFDAKEEPPSPGTAIVVG